MFATISAAPKLFENNAAIVVSRIDFLEVLDSEAPDGIPPNDDMRQRTLLVRLLRPVPAGLTADNTRIDGGGTYCTGRCRLELLPLMRREVCRRGLFRR